MNNQTFRLASVIGLICGVAVLSSLIGCVGGPGRSVVRVQSSPGYVQNDMMQEDDYVYYPGYETYYSSNRHQYLYRDGSNWVTRPAPSRVAVDVLLASPSVRVDFHDSPAQHHAAVVKSYPKNWKPAGNSPEVRKERPKEERRDEQNNRNDGQKHDKDEDDKRRN